MRKAITILALVAVAAFASAPRLTVLGGDARLLVNDYLEMWAFPGVVGDYEFITGSSETAENDSDGWFGIVDGLGGNTYGVTVNHNDYSHEVLFSPGGWGAIVSMDFNKIPVDATTERDIRFGVAWGTDVPFLSDYSDLAISAGFDNTSIDFNEDNWCSKDINFGVSLRGHGDSFFNLFPIISAGMSMYNVDGFIDDSTFSNTDIAVDFGAGRNKKVADNTNLVLGVFTGIQATSFSGDYAEGETSDSEMWIEIPKVSGGVEQEVGKIVVFRAGAVSTTNYYTKGDFNQFTTNFDTNFGVGLHWDNFIVDATISEGFLHSGPYMVGGNANGFMGSLAATYSF